MYSIICDVLRPIDVIFRKDNTKCIRFFAFQIFLTVGKFATFSERPKAKSVSASEGRRTPWPLDQGFHTCIWRAGPQTF